MLLEPRNQLILLVALVGPIGPIETVEANGISTELYGRISNTTAPLLPVL